MTFFLDGATSHALDRISLQLAWKHQFQFAGYYAALHKGYYKQSGLDVTIVEGGEGKFAREELREGRAQYGIAGSELLLHRRDGDPFVVLAPIFQHSPSVLLVKKDSGIDHLQDLIGKKVMLLPGKKDADILAAFLNEGISLNSIQRLDQSYNIGELIQGSIDAVSAYTTNEPWLLMQENVECLVISPMTYGVDFYSDCLFTTEHELEKYPERVKRFLNMSLRGWEYAMDHPDEIIGILLEKYGVGKKRQHLRYEAESIREIMLPNLVQIGHMNPGRWRHIASTYEKLGLMEADFSLYGFLYDPNPKIDFVQLKKIILVAIAIISIMGLGTGILLFFNRKLKTEIHQRKRAEKELQRTLDATTDGIWSWDFRSDELHFSPQYYQMLGYEPDEFPPTFENWKNLIHPDDRDIALEKVGKYLKTKLGVYRNTCRLRTRNGEYRWIRAAAKVVERDENKKAVYLIGHHEDITERKRSEETLSINEQRYKSAQRIGNVGNWEYDLVTETFWGSDQAKRIYGLDPESDRFTTDEIENYIPEKERVHQALIDLIEKETPYNIEFDICPRSGPKTRTIRSIAEVVRNETGSPVKVFGVVQDITEQRKAEKEKIKLAEQLKQSQKMEAIGLLAGGIAHDFNNILSAIIGYTQLALSEVEKNSPIENDLQQIYVAGNRAKELVTQVLVFARQSEEELKPVRVDLILKEALQLIRSTIPTSIEIKTDINSNSLIMGNHTQIHQIVMNLSTNAAHAMEEHGGILQISLTDVLIDGTFYNKKLDLNHGDYIKISFSDTGTGIPSDILDSIFDPYFTTKKIGEGTGMGLAMVQGIVESYEGKISVESRSGKGSIFEIYLPVTGRSEPHRKLESEPLPTGTERVLIVDDEAPIATMLARNLKRLGYTVTSKTSSLEALELFQTKPYDFDIVVTDMTMPNLTGDTLAIKLMKIRQDIPIILCTGYSKKISNETASEIGIKAFIHKPVLQTEFVKTVREVLDEANS